MKIIYCLVFQLLCFSVLAQTEKDLYFVKRATAALLKVPQDSAIIANTLLAEIVKIRLEAQIAEKKRAEAQKLAEYQAAMKGDSVMVNPSNYKIDSMTAKSIDFEAVEQMERLAASGYRSSLDEKIADELPTTTIAWQDTLYDFGTIKAGKSVSYRFLFNNTGQQDFVIARVKPSCGCTTTDYTKTPVAAGETGFVEITFNSTGKYGRQEKHVTVIGNFEDDTQQQLFFTGQIIDKKKK